ncbi:MAG: 50S ribosomal protein L23 [Tissierellia bacterium]|nr:50S ribosomal protein L23 [Tissierellia bacterium]
MNRNYDIIIRPIITERSMDDMEFNKYTFVVAKDATKPEIKRAIESIFDVTVEKVTTQNRYGKLKRQGMTSGRRPSWEKAIVKLAEGSKSIEFFEGME